MSIFEEYYCYDGINQFYRSILNTLYCEPDFECSPRGMKIKELLSAKIIINNPRERILQIEARKMSYAYMWAEFLWYMSGSNSLATMQYYSKRMKNYSDDGLTLNSAYGYRVGFGKTIHPVINHNQFQRCIEKLKEDRDSRQAIIHIQTSDELLRKTADLTCSLTIQYFIRENKLYCIVNMRSNDIWFGSVYDIFSFTMWQEIMSIELGVELGKYIHIANSLHLYEKDFEQAIACIEEQKKEYTSMIPMTKSDIEELPLMIENEQSIRLEGKVKHQLKSQIWNEAIKVLLDYRKQKEEKNGSVKQNESN